MKKWPWHKFLIIVGWLLVLAGIAPGAYIVVQLGSPRHPKPLSVPVSLKSGQFTSPYFTANASGAYRIDLDWDQFPARQTKVDLDWKIVADNGSLVQQGISVATLRGANTLMLGKYQPNAGQREQAILNVHEDVEGPGVNAKLEIGPPETNLELSSVIPFAARCALFVAGTGAILLFVLLILGTVRRNRSAAVR